jgi:hypothetical protein
MEVISDISGPAFRLFVKKSGIDPLTIWTALRVALEAKSEFVQENGSGVVRGVDTPWIIDYTDSNFSDDVNLTDYINYRLQDYHKQFFSRFEDTEGRPVYLTASIHKQVHCPEDVFKQIVQNTLFLNVSSCNCSVLLPLEVKIEKMLFKAIQDEGEEEEEEE